MAEQFLYKAWANAELLDKIGQICKEENPEQWVMAVRLLNHTCIVDQIFIAHMKIKPHTFRTTNTSETPSIDELRKNINTTDDWLIQNVKKIRSFNIRSRIKILIY